MQTSLQANISPKTSSKFIHFAFSRYRNSALRVIWNWGHKCLKMAFKTDFSQMCQLWLTLSGNSSYTSIKEKIMYKNVIGIFSIIDYMNYNYKFSSS